MDTLTTPASSRGEMSVELFYWAGCPSTDAAIALLSTELARLGLDPSIVRLCPIVTPADARHEQFPGSPTIRVNARDVVQDLGPPLLGCRVYYLRDGRVSALPDVRDVRDALEAGLADARSRDQGAASN